MKWKILCILFILFGINFACTLFGGPDSEEDLSIDREPSISEDNHEFPDAEEADGESRLNRIPDLYEVTRWFYYLDVNLDDDTLDRIVESAYDMVVIDFIASEANNSDYPLTETVERMHRADHPKLVIAYIDIGQAEDFRYK